MGLLKRIFKRLKQQGIGDILYRAGEQLWRSITQKTFLFCVDLPELPDEPYTLPEGVTITRVNNADELTSQDMQELSAYRDRSVLTRQLPERFGKGAVLWLVRFKGETAGFKWTIRGTTPEPNYIPFTKNDARTFDSVTFHKFRGKRLNVVAYEYIFRELKKDGVMRVFSHVQNWNTASIRSLQKTSESIFGIARKFSLFGKVITVWSSVKRSGR